MVGSLDLNSEDERGETEPEPSLGEVVDRAVRRIATTLVIASGVIALAIYSRPGPPRYEAVASGAGMVRIDTRTGTMIACEAGRCYTMLRRGQDLDRRPAPPALPKPAEERALPAK